MVKSPNISEPPISHANYNRTPATDGIENDKNSADRVVAVACDDWSFPGSGRCHGVDQQAEWPKRTDRAKIHKRFIWGSRESGESGP